MAKILVANGAELTTEIRAIASNEISENFCKELQEIAIKYRQEKVFQSPYNSFMSLLTFMLADINKQGKFLREYVVTMIINHIAEAEVSVASREKIAEKVLCIYDHREAAKNYGVTIPDIIKGGFKSNLRAIMNTKDQKTHVERYAKSLKNIENAR